MATTASNNGAAIAALTREGALLWAVHQCLLQHWVLSSAASETAAVTTQQEGCELRELARFAGNVSVLPGVLYAMDATSSIQLEVRAIAIQQKLFVHFVVINGVATRLDLRTSEYTKPATTCDVTHEGSVDGGSRLIRVGDWVVNVETLRWRLERTVFPLFSDGVDVQAGADLGRLPESIVLQMAPFLTVRDYCRVTEANQHLRSFASRNDIWHGFVQREFPNECSVVSDAKQTFVALHAVRQYDTEYRRAALRERAQWLPTDPPPNLGEGPIYPPLGVPPMRLPIPDLAPPPFRGCWQPTGPRMPLPSRRRGPQPLGHPPV